MLLLPKQHPIHRQDYYYYFTSQSGHYLNLHCNRGILPEVKDFLAIFCGQEIHELAIEYVQERGYMGIDLPIKGYATDELLFYQPVVLLLFHRGHFKNHKEPFLNLLSSLLYCIFRVSFFKI